MAENALAHLDRFGPGASAILRAHHLHVWLELGAQRRLGGHLRDRVGMASQCVCFWFGAGECNAGSGGAIFEGESQFVCRCVAAQVCDVLVYFREVQPPACSGRR